MTSRSYRRRPARAVAPAQFGSLDTLEHRRLLAAYALIDLGAMLTGDSFARDINNLNQVVGFTESASGDRGFLFKDANDNGVAEASEFKTMNPLSGHVGSAAYAINDGGVVVGSSDSGTRTRAVRFSAATGAATDLNIGTPSTGSGAYDVNASGTIVGWHGAGLSFNGFVKPASGSAETISPLGTTFGAPYSEATAINDNGLVAGYSSTDEGDSAFVKAPGGAVTPIGFDSPEGYSYDYGWAINNAGLVVGEGFVAGADPDAPDYHAFLYDTSTGNVTDLGALPGLPSTHGYGINAGGAVVGAARPGEEGGIPHAFLYANGAMHDLNGLIPSGSGWTLTHARSINDNGYIVGYGIGPGGTTRAFLLKPTGSTPSPVVTVNGDQAGPTNDSFLLRRGAGSTIEVFVNNTTQTPTTTFSSDGVQQLVINGGAGSDAIVTQGDLPFQLVVQSATASLTAHAKLASLNIAGSSQVKMPAAGNSVLVLGSITFGAGASLDLADNSLVVDDPAGTGMADLKQHRAAGRIVTSVSQIDGLSATLARVDNRLVRQSSWDGRAINASGIFAQTIVTHARVGDADLDGRVDEADYRPIVANMGRTNAQWVLGDVNDDGTVTSDDFALVTSQIGARAATPAAPIQATSDSSDSQTAAPSAGESTPSTTPSTTLGPTRRARALPKVKVTRAATRATAERHPVARSRQPRVLHPLVMTDKSSTGRSTDLAYEFPNDIFETNFDRVKARLRSLVAGRVS